MVICDLCDQYTKRRKKLKQEFNSTTNKQLKLVYGREWKSLAKKESMVCNECFQSKMNKLKVPPNTLRGKPSTKWPSSNVCNPCKGAVSAANNLNLYMYAKGKESTYLDRCNQCLEECSRYSNSCPGVEKTRDLLLKRSLDTMPKLNRKR